MTSPSPPPISYRPDLPDWGVYLRWPAEDDAWLHAEDVALARELIPSRRVFRRSAWDGQYYHLHYGANRLRVRPSMWVSVPAIDLEVEQEVEVLYRHGRNDPGIFRIADIFYAPEQREIEFYLYGQSLRLPRKFSRRDLQPLHEQHELRVGYYAHQPPRARIPEDVELLDVGKITE
jgi:hypothetical protein